MNLQSRLTAVAESRHGKKKMLLKIPVNRFSRNRIFAMRKAKGICSANEPSAKTNVLTSAFTKCGSCVNS